MLATAAAAEAEHGRREVHSNDRSSLEGRLDGDLGGLLVEREDPVAGLTRHQVPQGADGDGARAIRHVGGFTAALEPVDDGVLGGVDENIEELVRLDTDSAPAGHLDLTRPDPPTTSQPNQET